MKQSCKEIVADILPETGFWWGEYKELDLDSKKFIFKNIPYHACDVEWLKRYIKNYLFKQFSIIKLMAVNKYLETVEFMEQIREYQNKIIDWQINFSDIHNIDFYKKLNSRNATKDIEVLFNNVYKVLTEELKMDSDIVKSRLEELKPEKVKQLKKYYKRKNNNFNFSNIEFISVDESKYGEI